MTGSCWQGQGLQKYALAWAGCVCSWGLVHALRLPSLSNLMQTDSARLAGHLHARCVGACRLDKGRRRNPQMQMCVQCMQVTLLQHPFQVPTWRDVDLMHEHGSTLCTAWCRPADQSPPVCLRLSCMHAAPVYIPMQFALSSTV